MHKTAIEKYFRSGEPQFKSSSKIRQGPFSRSHSRKFIVKSRPLKHGGKVLQNDRSTGYVNRRANGLLFVKIGVINVDRQTAWR